MNYCDEIRAKFGTFGLPESDYYRVYGEWTHTPCFVGNDLVAVALSMGTEIHLARLVEPMPRLRSVLKQAAKGVIESQGLMTTTVDPSDAASRRFVERIGFSKCGASVFGDEYMVLAEDWRY